MDITDENNFKYGKFWTLNRTYTTGIIDRQMLKFKYSSRVADMADV